MGKHRTPYPLEFRAHMVELVKAGRTPEEFAREFEPTAQTIIDWVAQAELDTFAEGLWGRKFPPVNAAWRSAWDRVIPFFAFPPAVRKAIYTTNAIENINSQLRKIIKTRCHFPTNEAATKPIWLALRNITADWGRAAHDWKVAMSQFAILSEDRFVRPFV
ncbi:mutator family transposase [Paraburkholderia unamae]|nr:mutator family transposase [Paraburkholderia unamae]